jgi:stress-induced morphogen
MYSTRARRKTRSVSVTFRGYTPRDQLVLEVRNEASRLDDVDDVHAVIRADGTDHVEVVVQATRGEGQVHCKVRHRDVRVALAEAFERLALAHRMLSVSTAAISAA